MLQVLASPPPAKSTNLQGLAQDWQNQVSHKAEDGQEAGYIGALPSLQDLDQEAANQRLCQAFRTGGNNNIHPEVEASRPFLFARARWVAERRGVFLQPVAIARGGTGRRGFQ